MWSVGVECGCGVWVISCAHDALLIPGHCNTITLIQGQIWRDLILFLKDLQSNLCECQRLSRGDVVDYAPLTELNEPFVATNTPRAHTTLTKEDEHVNLFCMHWEGSVHLLEHTNTPNL